MLHMQDLFFWTGKNMATLSELILQMVTYFHVDSHVKPWKVKMHMQMRAGRKEHKNNECCHSASFFYNCIGQELVRKEAAGSLKRVKRLELLNMKRRCYLVIAGFCG